MTPPPFTPPQNDFGKGKTPTLPSGWQPQTPPSRRDSGLVTYPTPPQDWRKAWMPVQLVGHEFTVQLPLGMVNSSSEMKIDGQVVATQEVTSEEGPASFCVIAMTIPESVKTDDVTLSKMIFGRFSSQNPGFCERREYGLNFTQARNLEDQPVKTIVLVHRNGDKLTAIVMNFRTSKYADFRDYSEKGVYDRILSSFRSTDYRVNAQGSPNTNSHEILGMDQLMAFQHGIHLPAKKLLLTFVNSGGNDEYSTAFINIYSTETWKQLSSHDLGIPVNSVSVHEGSNRIIIGSIRRKYEFSDEIRYQKGPSEFLAYALDSFLNNPKNTMPVASYKTAELLLENVLSLDGEYLYTLEPSYDPNDSSPSGLRCRVLKFRVKTMTIEKTLDMKVGLSHLVLSPDGSQLLVSEYYFDRINPRKSMARPTVHWLDANKLVNTKTFELSCNAQACTFYENNSAMVCGKASDGKGFEIHKISMTEPTKRFFKSDKLDIYQLQYDANKDCFYGVSRNHPGCSILEWTKKEKYGLALFMNQDKVSLPGSPNRKSLNATLGSDMIVVGDDWVFGSGARVRLVKR
ncbi:MAG: hypothetical protein ACRC8S_09610 [Fimbriiglobus sp.]